MLFLAGACKKEAPPVPPAAVTVSPVISGVIPDSLQLVGQVKAQKRVDLEARVKGFLLKQNFKEGDAVEAGTILYEIEPEQYQAELQTAEASYQKALADQTNADSDYNRQETLYKSNAVSERVRDEALARKMEADAQVKAAAAAIDTAKLQLGYTKIRAPFDGRVGLVNYDIGNVVSSTSGPLLTIVSTGDIDVEFSISETALLQLLQTTGKKSVSDTVRVRLLLQNGMEYPHLGKITKYDNRVNPNTGMQKVKASFENPDRVLVDGMYVKVLLESIENPEILIVPRQAVLDSQGQKYVLTVDKDNTVVRRTVTLGSNDELFVEIKDGLNKDEQVIVEGQQKVRPQSKVNPKTDERFTSQEAAEELYKLKRPQKISITRDTGEKAARQPSPVGTAVAAIKPPPASQPAGTAVAEITPAARGDK